MDKAASRTTTAKGRPISADASERECRSGAAEMVQGRSGAAVAVVQPSHHIPFKVVPRWRKWIWKNSVCLPACPLDGPLCGAGRGGRAGACSLAHDRGVNKQCSVATLFALRRPAAFARPSDFVHTLTAGTLKRYNYHSERRENCPCALPRARARPTPFSHTSRPKRRVLAENRVPRRRRWRAMPVAGSLRGRPCRAPDSPTLASSGGAATRCKWSADHTDVRS